MLIDWFTVGAQALNFVILVWLMKRFLYKPILDAIDSRERRIASALADAEAKRAEAHKERDEFRLRNDELERRRAALLDQAMADAEAERQRLIDEARQAADALTTRRREALLGDSRRLGQALVGRTQQEVFAIARKALSELATASLEERIAEVLASRLRALEGPDKEAVAQALASGTGPALVRSAFELPAEQRSAIQLAVNEAFSADIALRFETAPDLVAGVELISNGQKVAWSIADYLASLRAEVEKLIQSQWQSQPQRQQQPVADPGNS